MSPHANATVWSVNLKCCSPHILPCPLTGVVEISGPLIVVSQLGEHRLGDELLGLVVQVELQVVPQQQVQQDRLPVGVVTQRGRTQTGVEEAGGRGMRRYNGKESWGRSASCRVTI